MYIVNAKGMLSKVSIDRQSELKSTSIDYSRTLERYLKICHAIVEILIRLIIIIFLFKYPPTEFGIDLLLIPIQ